MRYAEAQRFYQKAITLQPNFVFSYINLAAILLDTNRPEEALTQAEIAIKIDSNSMNAHHIAGLIHLRLRNSEMALTFLQKAIALDPTYEKAWYHYAVACKYAAKIEEAEKGLRKAIELKPKMIPAHRELISLLKDKQDYVGAIAQCRRLLELTAKNTWQNAQALWQLAANLYSKPGATIDELREAIDSCNQAAENKEFELIKSDITRLLAACRIKLDEEISKKNIGKSKGAD